MQSIYLYFIHISLPTDIYRYFNILVFLYLGTYICTYIDVSQYSEIEQLTKKKKKVNKLK